MLPHLFPHQPVSPVNAHFKLHECPRPAPGSYNSSSMAGLSASLSNPNSYGTGCFLDGQPVSCTEAALLVNHDAARVESILSVGSLSSSFSPGDVTPVSQPDKMIPGTGDDPDNHTFDGGTTLGYVNVEFFVTPGSQQTTVINQQKPIPVPLPDLKSAFQKMLSNPDCGKFVADLLKQAVTNTPNDPPQGDSLMDLFEKISSQGNYVLKDDLRIEGRVIGGTVSGSIYSKNGLCCMNQ